MSLTVLSNRYSVLNVLGDGGFGQTFLVEDTQMPSNRKCVLKQLKPVHSGAELRQLVQDRFQREAAILELLGEQHDQIPSLYAYFSEAEEFYLVQEWIDGVTVAEKVQREGKQSEQSVKAMISQLLDVLAYIHSKGIVHRDIKPDNIILRSHDHQPVLIDFGAVKETMNTIVHSQAHSTRSIVVGTPGYMPPEQLSGRPVYASDIYSLGMTAVYMLTAKVPQELLNDPASGQLLWHEHAPHISSAFAAFIDDAIHTSIKDRFSTIQQMKTALQLVITSTDPTQIGQLLDSPPDNARSSHTPVVSSAVPVVSSSAPTVTDAVTRQQNSNNYPRSIQDNNTTPVSTSKNTLVVGSLVGVSILIGAAMIGRNLPISSELPPEPIATETLPLDPIATSEPVAPVAIDPPTAIPPTIEPPIFVEPSTPSTAWEFMGTASSGEAVSVDVNSIRPLGDSVDFDYKIGNEIIVASADCFQNRWYAEQNGWYSPQSNATQSMQNFVCQ